MRELHLPSGEIAIYDDEDAELIAAHRWRAERSTPYTTYVSTNVYRADGRRTSAKLHRLLLGCTPGDGREVDHVNCDGLDNRRANLRIATHGQNRMNARPQGGSSRFKGVYFNHGRWCARITVDGCLVQLGRYDQEKDAARAYDAAAVEHFGERARPNGVAR